MSTLERLVFADVIRKNQYATSDAVCAAQVAAESHDREALSVCTCLNCKVVRCVASICTTEDVDDAAEQLETKRRAIMMRAMLDEIRPTIKRQRR
jgi:hypothetical protein